jgi:hypothetical protein
MIEQVKIEYHAAGFPGIALFPYIWFQKDKVDENQTNPNLISCSDSSPDGILNLYN